ncbi:MAG: MFS transporter [Niabella sp.]
MQVTLIRLLTLIMGSNNKNIRWGIGAMLFFVSALNYLDRQVLSVLAPTIQKRLHLSDMDYSFITSAFLVSYTVMYSISGRMIDSIGVRKGLLWFAGGWSLANALHGFARTVTQFSVFRFLLGITESANFPAGIKAVTEWFPLKERALAIGLLNAGSSLGAAIAIPMVSFAAIKWGWQSAFMITGVMGFVWVFFWWKFYRTPTEHPRISKEELAYIAGDNTPERKNSKPVPLIKLLKTPAVWGCFLPRILIDPCTYFLIFWIPKYLQDVQGMKLNELGYFAWIPYVFLSVGTILGGALPKRLINKGWTLNKARKTTMLFASLLIPACCLLLYISPNIAVAVAAIAGVMMGHGLWGNITIPTEVFTKDVQGTITGLGGTLGGAAAIGIQFLTAWTIHHISYIPIFIGIGIIYLVTYIGVNMLVGKLGVIRTVE